MMCTFSVHFSSLYIILSFYCLLLQITITLHPDHVCLIFCASKDSLEYPENEYPQLGWGAAQYQQSLNGKSSAKTLEFV